eukprot:3389754-Amphidinium_carterae.1
MAFMRQGHQCTYRHLQWGAGSAASTPSAASKQVEPESHGAGHPAPFGDRWGHRNSSCMATWVIALFSRFGVLMESNTCVASLR